MHRWLQFDRELPADRTASDAPAHAPSGLLFTCSEECFAPRMLAAQLKSGYWRVHRTDGAIVPPRGAGHHVEEELIDDAVDRQQVDQIVVCGHWPCGVLSRLLEADAPADDFVLRHWLSHADAVRALLADAPAGTDRLRRAVEQTIHLQLAHLRTHPAVAVGLQRGTLRLSGWMHDDRAGELFFAAGDSPRCDRRVALAPDQNTGLRAEVIRGKRPAPLHGLAGAGRPYLA